MKIAVIGAGMAGISASLELQNHADVTLFEKSRGVGRLATRYNQEFQYNFGAPFFRIKTPEFKFFLKEHLAESTDAVLHEWYPKISELHHDNELSVSQSPHPYYVSLPKMTSLGRQLAKSLKRPIQFNTRITSIEKNQQKWRLKTDSNEITTEFDWVIFATPLEQTKQLLPDDFCYADLLQHCKTDACFTLMLGINNEATDDAHFLKLIETCDMINCSQVSDSIEKIIIENKKAHPKLEQVANLSLTVFSKNNWAEAHVDNKVESVKHVMIAEVIKLLKISKDTIKHAVLHRWRYANVNQSVYSIDNSKKHLIDKQQQIACIGDWCYFGSVEGAWVSALSASSSMQSFIC